MITLKRLLNCSGWVKRILTTEKNYERMASSLNYPSLRGRIRYGGKTLLRSSNVENDDEKHHHELLRYSGMKNRKVEPTMKNLKDLGERHFTDDNSFLRQTSKRIFEDSSGRIRRVR